MPRSLADLPGLPLFLSLRGAEGRDGVSEAEVIELAALITNVAKKVAPLLGRISHTFSQYTEHDIGHSINLVYLMGRIIPSKTVVQLNALELSLAILAALLHDGGMFITDTEKQTIINSDSYRDFLGHHGDRVAAIEEARMQRHTVRADAIEGALLAEFVRSRHAVRVRDFITMIAGVYPPTAFCFRDADFSGRLADLCESHAWPIREEIAGSNRNIESLPTRWLSGSVPANFQYLGCLLRLADIMDFDRSRTPLSVYQNVSFTENKSWEEWNKHLQISGWDVAEERVRFQAECTHPAFYVAVNEFLDWIDAELRECRYLLDESPRNLPDYYTMRLPPAVDRRPVKMKDSRYIAGGFRFTLDSERVIDLLMDKSLYPDESLFLRELLQNSLDACRLKEARMLVGRVPICYMPRIEVWDYTADASCPRIVFQDNGVGMSKRTFERYFMQVGKSYYQSTEFAIERAKVLDAQGSAGRLLILDMCSRFGIGILSCFLVADRFTVETLADGDDPLKVSVEGTTKYFVIERLPRPSQHELAPIPCDTSPEGPLGGTGTRITLPLRNGAHVKVFDTILKYGVNLDYDVVVHIFNEARPRVVHARAWEPNIYTLTELTNSLRLGSIRSYAYDTDWKALAKSVENVVSAARVPFEKWRFSEHIRGSAWFWLLRGANGLPCIRRGFISVAGVGDGYALKLSGLPSYFQCLRHALHNSLKGRDQLAKGKDILQRGIEDRLDPIAIADALEAHPMIYNAERQELQQQWAQIRRHYGRLNSSRRWFPPNRFSIYSRLTKRSLHEGPSCRRSRLYRVAHGQAAGAGGA